ncbi:MAG: 4-hydroxy-tetrahydrodipicolinate synthase [Gammaproteobacteria bacterium]|nr:4-hydroxy-tetrahydrodipicolinate synthase [Gammaproteobacteria bacterium]
MAIPALRGSIVAITTPMHDDGRIDYEALAGLIDWHVASGTAGIVAAGTTGESPTLESDEHYEYIARCVELADGRIPVIAGTGSNSTQQTLKLTKRTAELDIAACLMVVPYYNKPGQKDLYAHFSTIADAVDVPILLYNVPGRTVADLKPETVIRLAPHENIIGIKEASADLDRVRQIRAACGPDFLLHSGDDATACEFMLQGGDGVVSVTANVAPQQMAKMCEAALAGDREAAEAADQPLRALHRDLFVEANPIPVKWALHAMGRAPGGIRLPLTPLDSNNEAVLRDALAAADISVA